jgi:hypothetical protein
MPYDENLDNILEEYIDEEAGIRVTVASYNDGPKKIRLAKAYAPGRYKSCYSFPEEDIGALVALMNMLLPEKGEE